MHACIPLKNPNNSTMAGTELRLSTIISLGLLLLLFGCCEALDEAESEAEAEAEGMFVFGSSLVDNGNNNFLNNSSARADYPPYGIDFPLGPSGRFSNGRNVIDALGELLRLRQLIPPFADPSTMGRRIVHGVNFASGGSGILDRTGALAGEVISMNQQIKNFEMKTLPALRNQLQLLKGNQKLSNYLFVVGTGGNDYLLNYFVSAQKNKPTLSQFTSTLIATLSGQIKKLYGLGARKFVIFSIQAMGCVPMVRTNLNVLNGSCVEALNKAAILFNSHLRSLVNESNCQMPGSSMVFIDSYRIIRDIIDNPLCSGFVDTTKACCELPANKGEGAGILCQKRGGACRNRDSHVFFDGLHPTDAVNARIAHKAYASHLKREAYPINVKQLAQLQIL